MMESESKEMSGLEQHFLEVLKDEASRLIFSRPEKNYEYKRIVAERKGKYYQIAKYTETQVFHENIPFADPKVPARRFAELTEENFRQVNGFGAEQEHMILISKKGKCTYKRRRTGAEGIEEGEPDKRGGRNTKQRAAIQKENDNSNTHNRRKSYLLPEGTEIAPLADMGVFTKDGKVVSAMYDKYRQINRFLEIIDDEIADSGLKELHVIDFGCGKSYLTFVVYYYLTVLRHMKVQMIGLDLKADVIRKCNAAAQKYGYSRLTFELGDINGFKAPFDVDMVITLHACDTATDYALYNAIQWKAKMIFSVPCCQHELNGQIEPQNLNILSRYGIVKERFCALATDAVRGNLLEYSGYKTQLLEFIDFEHTPKNILIRAVKRPVTPKGVSEKAVAEVERLIKEFGFSPKLWELLGMKKDDEMFTTK